MKRLKRLDGSEVSSLLLLVSNFHDFCGFIENVSQSIAVFCLYTFISVEKWKIIGNMKQEG